MRDRAQVVYLVVFLDLMMMFALVPLLPDYQSAYHLTKTQAGLVIAAYSVAVLVLSAPVGWLADRIGPRRLVIAGVWLMVFAAPAYALSETFGALLVARTLQGAASAVSWTAGLAWLMSANSPAHRGRVLGTATGCGTAGILAGPVFGGVVGSVLGIHAPFIILGVVAAAAALLAMRSPEPARADFDQVSLVAVVRRGMRESAIVVASLLIFLAAIVGGTTETLVPLFLGHHGYDALWITVVLAATGVLAVITNQWVGRLSDRRSRKRIALVACTGTAAGLVLLVLAPSPAVLALVFVIMTPAISGLYAIGYPLSAVGAEGAALGHSSVFGVINLVWGAGFVAGPAAGAAIAAASSDEVAYALLFALTLSAGFYVRSLALD